VTKELGPGLSPLSLNLRSDGVTSEQGPRVGAVCGVRGATAPAGSPPERPHGRPRPGQSGGLGLQVEQVSELEVPSSRTRL